MNIRCVKTNLVYFTRQLQFRIAFYETHWFIIGYTWIFARTPVPRGQSVGNLGRPGIPAQHPGHAECHQAAGATGRTGESRSA